MPAISVVANILFALSPTTAILLTYIVWRPQLVLLCLFASFVYLSSILLSSLLWLALVPVRDLVWVSLVYSVILQEASRTFLFWLTSKSWRTVKASAHVPDSPYNLILTALAFGAGFGGTASGLASLNTIFESWGPGTLPMENCGDFSFFTYTSINSGLLAALHIPWTIQAFDGFQRRAYHRVGFVLLSHALVSALSLLNELSTPMICTVEPAVLSLILVVSAYDVHHIAESTYKKHKNR